MSVFARVMILVTLASAGVWAYAHLRAHNSLVWESWGFVVAIIGTAVACLAQWLFGRGPS